MGASHSVRRATVGTNHQMAPGVRRMHLAVICNDVESLSSILRAGGVDVNAVWFAATNTTAKNGCTALIQAVALNHVSIVRRLLQQRDVDVQSPDANGVSPLMKAAYHGRAEIAELLVCAGAKLDEVDGDGNSVLHQCLRHGTIHGRAACVAVLIQFGADVNHRNNAGATPLHAAAAGGEPTMVAWLLASGADRNALDSNYCTPLWHCVQRVIEQERRAPRSWLRTTLLHRSGMLRMLLIRAEVDSLGFATWLHRIAVDSSPEPHVDRLHSSGILIEQMQLTDWVRQNRPETLKHICRVQLQQWLAFTPIRHQYCCRKIKQLPIPEDLKRYLARRLLPT